MAEHLTSVHLLLTDASYHLDGKAAVDHFLSESMKPLKYRWNPI